MSTLPVRWGILGTANIARKNWKAIRNCSEATLVALASRDLQRSRQFVSECQSSTPFETEPRALGSYEALLAAPDVEAIYLPLPTAVRKEWVLRAAAAGKHVLCEKPCAVSLSDLKEMTEACRRHGVQFMDGVMFMHSGRLERIRKTLDEETLGHMKRITSAFCFPAPPEFFQKNIRVQGALEPQGCLGDLGWYCLRLALFIQKWNLPESVSGRVLSSVPGVDGSGVVPTEFSGELFFSEGISAAFYCSFLSAHQQWARISGTRACLEMDDFVLPVAGSESKFRIVESGLKIRGCDFEVEEISRSIGTPEQSNSHFSAQETNMFRNFSRQIREGGLQARWPEFALKTQQVMEACLQSSAEAGARIQL